MNELGSKYKELYDRVEIGDIIEIEDQKLRFGLVIKIYVTSCAVMITGGDGRIFTVYINDKSKIKIIGKIKLKKLIETISKLS